VGLNPHRIGDDGSVDRFAAWGAVFRRDGLISMA
jgi:hypothetical protein